MKRVDFSSDSSGWRSDQVVAEHVCIHTHIYANSSSPYSIELKRLFSFFCAISLLQQCTFVMYAMSLYYGGHWTWHKATCLSNNVFALEIIKVAALCEKIFFSYVFLLIGNIVALCRLWHCWIFYSLSWVTQNTFILCGLLPELCCDNKPACDFQQKHTEGDSSL